jgi:hypothetical protein
MHLERGQPYGKASGRSLSALVAGKQVRVEYDNRDRYGRIIGVMRVYSGCRTAVISLLWRCSLNCSDFQRGASGGNSDSQRRGQQLGHVDKIRNIHRLIRIMTTVGVANEQHRGGHAGVGERG